MDEQVADALSRAFPDRDVASTRAAEGAWNPGNRTVRVEFADGDACYLKLAVDGRGARVEREAAALRYAGAHSDARVPAVVASDPGGDPPFLVTAPLAGTPVSDPWPAAGVEERERLLRGVGGALASVHAAAFDGPGRVRGGGADALDLSTGDWSAVLASAVEERTVEVGVPDRFADAPGRVADALHASGDLLDDAPAALLHGDPSRENAFLAASGSSTPCGTPGPADASRPGLIDWERALVGDPALDVVRAEAQQVELPDVSATDRLRAALRAGYRDRAGGLPAGFAARRPAYRAVTFLIQVETFEHWAPAAEEPVETLAAWVHEELDRRIDRL